MLPEITTLKLRRRYLGLSQRKLAELSGVSQGAIAKIEAGAVDPGYSTVKRLFRVLSGLEKTEEKQAKDIMSKPIVCVSADDSIEKALNKMVKKGFSVIPVMEKNQVIGRISDKILLFATKEQREGVCDKIMGPPLITLSEDTQVSLIKDLLKVEDAVVVVKGKKPVGIITKNDVLQ
ncbi:MAG: CBS domain-containing protein [Candidatus Altiarchaeota archaeon]|nr:CBS domain-containing protein [Candidatus Altiarchaeota archaeon]